MSRNLAIFAITFALGAVLAVFLRAVTHRPYAVPTTSGMTATATATAATAPASEPVPNHEQHQPAAPATTATSVTAAGPVNSICPICAMPVKLALGTATFQGQQVGFGCKACPAKFAADPQLYGPAALKNQVVE